MIDDMPSMPRRARGRNIVFALTALVAVAVLAAAAIAWLSFRDPVDHPFVLAQTPTAEAKPPQRVEPPSEALQLPADAPVGLADLVYAPCARDCAPYLVVEGSKQYRLPQQSSGTPTRGFTLSPDGRWLGRRAANGYLVRDLTSATEHRIDGDLDPWVWSPDARWLLLAEHTDGTVKRYVTFNVQTRQTQSHAPKDAADWRAVGVLQTGDVLLARGEGGSAGGRPVRTARLSLRTVDAATGTERSQSTIDLGDTVRQDESVTGFLELAPGAETALIGVFTANDTGQFSALSGLVQVDVASGRVRLRRDLAPREGSGPWLTHGFIGTEARLTWTSSTGVEWIAGALTGPDDRVMLILPRDSRVIGRGEGRY